MDRRLVYRLILAIFPQLMAVVIVAFPTLSSASESAIADEFTRKVEAFRQLIVENLENWSSPQSPWFAYIGRQFEEGLSPAQVKQYLTLQSKGQCAELLKLEISGFLNLYPELSEALSEKVVENIFVAEIISANSFGFRRCRALSMLNPIIEIEKKLDPEFYYLTIPSTDLGNKLGVIYDDREIDLRKAFKILFDLAACGDYKPAISDILEYNKLFLIFVGHREQYYFYIRAKHYNLEAPELSTVEEEARQFDLSNPYPQHGLLPKLKVIGYILARGDLDAARKIVFNLTYISCGRRELE